MSLPRLTGTSLLSCHAQHIMGQLRGAKDAWNRVMGGVAAGGIVGLAWWGRGLGREGTLGEGQQLNFRLADACCKLGRRPSRGTRHWLDCRTVVLRPCTSMPQVPVGPPRQGAADGHGRPNRLRVVRGGGQQQRLPAAATAAAGEGWVGVRVGLGAGTQCPGRSQVSASEWCRYVCD